MDEPTTDILGTTSGTTNGTTVTPTNTDREVNPVGAGESGGTPELNTNGGVRQSTRKRRSPKSEDADSAATSSSLAAGPTSGTVEPASTGTGTKRLLRRSSSGGSEKRTLPEEMKNEILSSSKAGIVKRQSTRTKTPRQPYQDEFGQGSEKGSNGDVELLETEREDNDNADGSSSSNIDACASMLTMLDERSYQRSLICDATRLSRAILQPLALPWMHHSNPVARNLPFDIDDMTEILMVDDGFYTPYKEGPLGFGRYDIGQLRRGPLNTRLATSSDSWCAASRRSDDPGVLEVSSVVLPLHPRFPSIPEHEDADRSVSNEKEGEEIDTASSYEYFAPAGEISLRSFEHSSKTKRRKIEEVRSCTTRQLISVKVNSSSSRSSIFNDLQMDKSSRYGKLLEATMPSEVQNGRYLSTTKAQRVVDDLGTYDWRHGLPSTSTTGKNAKSTSCGRTRLIWTKKSPHDMPQKVFFTSLLTGARLEGASQKRPRDIKLALRVGGEIFGSVSSSDGSLDDIYSSNFPVAVPSGLSDSKYEHPRAVCMLDDEELVKHILNDTSRPGHDRGKARARSALLHPTTECLPDNNGLIGVICSSPGNISLPSVHECLNHAAKETDSLCCTVCWAPELDESSPVYECSECGVCAHLRCCYDQGETQPVSSNLDEAEYTWKCAVCSYKSTQQSLAGNCDPSTGVSNDQAKKSRRRSRPPQWLQDSHIDDPVLAGKSEYSFGEVGSHGVKCAACPYHGGAMSRVRVGNDIVWIHEVCRVWMKGSLPPPSSEDAEEDIHECALCGKGWGQNSLNSEEEVTKSPSEYVLKCAAPRCLVHFHPMCALLSRKLTEASIETDPMTSNDQTKTDDPVEMSKKMDEKDCACFTLTALDCEVKHGRIGKDPGTRETVKIPVGFCGIHNPSREAAYRGLYPAGKYFTPDVMKIPALV